MNGENYWKQFEESGSVADYLAYARGKAQENPRMAGLVAGEYPYAGYMLCDRNGDQPDSCRGI